MDEIAQHRIRAVKYQSPHCLSHFLCFRVRCSRGSCRPQAGQGRSQSLQPVVKREPLGSVPLCASGRAARSRNSRRLSACQACVPQTASLRTRGAWSAFLATSLRCRQAPLSVSARGLRCPALTRPARSLERGMRCPGLTCCVCCCQNWLLFREAGNKVRDKPQVRPRWVCLGRHPSTDIPVSWFQDIMISFENISKVSSRAFAVRWLVLTLVFAPLSGPCFREGALGPSQRRLQGTGRSGDTALRARWVMSSPDKRALRKQMQATAFLAHRLLNGWLSVVDVRRVQETALATFKQSSPARSPTPGECYLPTCSGFPKP